METLKLIKNNNVAHIMLNRPDEHNAFNQTMISELISVFTLLGHDRDIRVIVIQAEGKSFCSGADLNFMKEAAEHTEAQNTQDSLVMAHMFHTIYECPKPVIALAHGSVFGGGVGLLACCDIVIADPETKFGLTEVRLGLIPAVISPFVMAKIGASQARRYMLTGERFGAEVALRLGLIHEIGTETRDMISALLASGPEAVDHMKRLIRHLHDKPINEAVLGFTASLIAKCRSSAEGQEGIKAFFEKRTPNWVSK